MKKIYTAYIYCLESDETPFYIGVTIDYKKRIEAHKLLNKKLTSFVLHTITTDNSDIFEIEKSFWENHYIFLFRQFGFQLKNKNLNNGIRKFKPSIKKRAVVVQLWKTTITSIEDDAKKQSKKTGHNVTAHFLAVKTIEEKYGK